MRGINWVAIAAGILVFILVKACSQAHAHDAPSGWKYPFACCSGVDCRPVDKTWINMQPDGYHLPTGEVVPFSSSKLRSSPDGLYHWCTKYGKDDTDTNCLFVPPRSF